MKHRSGWRDNLVRPQWILVAVAAVVFVAAAVALFATQSRPPAHPSAGGGAASPSVDDPGAPAEPSASVSAGPSRSPSAKPSASPAAPKPVPGSVLWAADPGRGTRVFEGIEKAPGTVTVADDPQGRYGPSFRYETWENTDGSKARCESRGMRSPDGNVFALDSSHEGQVFYLGWRALWSPLPTQNGAWIALFQMHVDGVGAGGLNVGPFVLRTLGDGQLHFQLISPDGSDRHIWNGPLPVNSWSSFVIGFRLSRGGDGWVEFWYDGVQQTFTNGATRYPGATLWGTHDNVKWGIYRSGANHTGHAVAYLNHAQLGTTYTAVAP